MSYEIKEIWKVIPGTKDRYSVSNFGNVRANWSDIPQRGLTSRKRIEKSYLLKLSPHTTGYLRVALGRNKIRYVHRLVAQCFLDNPCNLPQVDHIDGQRNNNHVSNLRWVTARQNCLYGGERHEWEQQRIASAKRRIHEARKQEYESLLKEGYSLRKIARIFGTSHSCIRLALNS